LELVAFRLVQGIGGALIMANSVAYLVDIYPRDRRGFVFGTWEACIAIGLGIGPVIGGFLLSRWGWPPIFYVNLPFSLVMLAALPRVMVEPHRPRSRQSFDFLGAGCFVLALAPFMYAVTLGGDAGWTGPVILGCFAASLLGLIGFIVCEQRVPYPMVQLSMFRGRGFSAGNLAKVCGYFGLGATLLLLPFYLASELGLEAQVMGYTLAAFPIGMLVGSSVSGPLSDRLGTRLLGPGGLVLLAVSAAIQAQMTPAQGYTPVLAASLLAGLGVGTFIPPNDSAILSTTPPEKVGVANGIMGVSRSLGSMFGQSVIAGLLTVQLAVTGGDFLHGYHDAFVVVAVVTLVGATLATVRDRPTSP
jgi:MFS family permease